MITLTQLEYIVAIDEYRHFATAAEKCFVTQPTLSMQIKKLEDELGVIIFDRSRQPVVPTDLGAKLIEQARMTLSATQRIKEIISQHPNVRGNDIFMPDFFFLQQFAIRMCIYQHLFVEYGTLDNFFVVVRGNE